MDADFRTFNKQKSAPLKNLKKPIESIGEDEIIFYDIETGMEGAPYTRLKKLGVKYGFDGDVVEVKTPREQDRFREAYESPDVLKVGFNNLNFDDIVLIREGYQPNYQNLHDGFLMMKAISHGLPSYSLKYLNFHYFGDFHEPEMELEQYQKYFRLGWDQLPSKVMSPYLRHDLQQHQNIFQLAWETVQRPAHWDSYLLDLSQGPVIHEMTLQGGIFINIPACRSKIAYLEDRIQLLNDLAFEASDGQVTNANSSKQVGQFLNDEGFEMALTANGEFQLRKKELVDLIDEHPVAHYTFEIRKAHGTVKYFKNYLEAATHEASPDPVVRIPVSYSISGCSTRRYLSSSYFKINFQNPNEEAKSVQMVPEGWLGWWIDSTQIENVVHIYESEDDVRRKAYEADPKWSEYVWLANIILGTNYTKEELDKIPSPRVPGWSIYKEFKTVKLALNFGLGETSYGRSTGVEKWQAHQSFELIHEACPAIRRLQEKVKKHLAKYGFVTDTFGFRYTSKQAYKAVAYLIQGCGTASLPKAHLRDNFATIHRHDQRKRVFGRMQTTTHDENGGRLRLDLGADRIVDMLKELMYNMTDKYSHKFDNIPLRAKLYLSKTTAAKHIEIDISNERGIKTIINGEPCHKCDATGRIEKSTCLRCSGLGYS